MKRKYLVVLVSSLFILSACSNNDKIIRGPSEPNDNSEEIENPHLVKGITLNKLTEAINEAIDSIFDITSFKSSTTLLYSDIDSTSHAVVSSGPFEVDGVGMLYNNSILHVNFTASKPEDYHEILNDVAMSEGYFYINDAFNEIRLRFNDVSDNLTKDIKYLDYSPINYEKTFYPSHLTSLSDIDLSSVNLAGYLNDGRILFQVASLSSSTETLDEKEYNVITTKFENYLIKDNKFDEYQKSVKCTYTLSSDETFTFCKNSDLNSETYAYEDNGDFDKTSLPIVS